MKTFGGTIPKLFTLALTLLFASQEIQAQVDCCNVHCVANQNIGVIQTLLNNQVAGAEFRINRRKQVRINGIQSITVSGCEVSLRIDVTLRRRIRRNARGVIVVSTRITAFDGTSLCLADPELDRVNLSRTLRIGERFYQWIANIVIPETICVNVS